MALFRRNKQQSVLPDEVNQYYQSQQRERTGVAVFLGVIALVLTLLVVAGMFFAGRYVYQQITKDDEQTTSDVQNGDTKQDESTVSEQPATDQTQESGTVEAPANPTPSTTTQTTTTPATGDDATLPRTGDEGM